MLDTFLDGCLRQRRAVAVLLIAAAAEVALHELHAGEPLPELRAATLALAARDASVTSAGVTESAC